MSPADRPLAGKAARVQVSRWAPLSGLRGDTLRARAGPASAIFGNALCSLSSSLVTQDDTRAKCALVSVAAGNGDALMPVRGANTKESPGELI